MLAYDRNHDQPTYIGGTKNTYLCSALYPLIIERSIFEPEKPLNLSNDNKTLVKNKN